MGFWIDHGTLAALQRERRALEGYSEMILRLCLRRVDSGASGTLIGTLTLDPPLGW